MRALFLTNRRIFFYKDLTRMSFTHTFHRRRLSDHIDILSSMSDVDFLFLMLLMLSMVSLMITLHCNASKIVIFAVFATFLLVCTICFDGKLFWIPVNILFSVLFAASLWNQEEYMFMPSPVAGLGKDRRHRVQF